MRLAKNRDGSGDETSIGWRSQETCGPRQRVIPQRLSFGAQLKSEAGFARSLAYEDQAS